MSRRAWFLLGLIPLAGILTAPTPAEPTAEMQRYKSPLGLVVDEKGERAYVALHTAGAVAEVDLKAGKVLHEIPVGNGCYDLTRIGDMLYVTCEAEDALAAVDITKGKVVQRWKVGQSPRGVAGIPQGNLVYVACHDSAQLTWLDLDNFQLHSCEVSAGPANLAILRSGAVALTHTEAGTLGVFNNRSDPMVEKTTLEKTSNVRGLVAMKKAIGLVHQIPRPDVPASQVFQGWVFTNAVSLIGGVLLTLPLDEPQYGHADPSAMVVVPNNRHQFIVSAGANTVLALDTDRAQSFLGNQAEKGLDPYDVSGDLTASRHYIVAKLPTQANPRHLALSGDGKTLVVSNHLADSLTVIDTEKLQVVRHIPLGGPEPDAVRRGEILFNSGKMTFQGQFTCASCHPNGDQDGLNWDLERDGIGTFKNTKSLLGIKDTAPYGWLGSSPTLADRIRGTLRTLHRHEPMGTEVEDLAAYLESLPPPRPLPVQDADRPAIERGRLLFEGKASCSLCHPGPTFQDGKSHDVGTAGATDPAGRFDTPSLRGVARTAPYLHDGRAATLERIFTDGNPRKQHGAAHQLSAEELADLLAYLKGL